MRYIIFNETDREFGRRCSIRLAVFFTILTTLILTSSAFAAPPPAWVVEFDRRAPIEVGLHDSKCVDLAILACECWESNGAPGTAYWVAITDIWGQSDGHLAFLVRDDSTQRWDWAVSGPWCEAYEVCGFDPAARWAWGAVPSGQRVPGHREERMEVLK